MLKLKSAWQTGQIVLGEIASEIREAFRTIKRDEERLDRITRFLQSRQDQTFRQVHGFLRGIDHACRESSNQGTRLLEQRLTFWVTVKMIWRPYNWQRDFQADMEAKLASWCSLKSRTRCNCSRLICAVFGRNCKT